MRAAAFLLPLLLAPVLAVAAAEEAGPLRDEGRLAGGVVVYDFVTHAFEAPGGAVLDVEALLSGGGSATLHVRGPDAPAACPVHEPGCVLASFAVAETCFLAAAGPSTDALRIRLALPVEGRYEVGLSGHEGTVDYRLALSLDEAAPESTKERRVSYGGSANVRVVACGTLA